MGNLTIKEQIDRNNALIEKIMTPNVFTLNNTVADLLQENAELQKKCTHEFEDGYCVYCYKEEE